MKKLFIGSQNKHKIDEINAILKNNDLNIELFSPFSFNDDSDPIENGLSFEENATIKAKFYFDKYHLPTIGEDSGICIDYLKGLPGIYSKRFFDDLNNYDKNEKIIELLKNADNRNAHFVTCICYIDEKGDTHIFNGINNGTIAFKQAGHEGFGYDPIFVIPEFNKTEAELGNDYKNENSHRARAFKEFINYLKTYEK